MRLSPNESHAIVSVFQPVLTQYRGELYLFGSRTDDKKKGGDIDLLVIVPNEHQAIMRESKVTLIDRIHDRIGEQRIDLTIASPEKMNSDDFLLSIRPSMIQLFSASAPTSHR